MAFTYTLGKVKTEALHWIRWKVGATKSDRPLVQDEEIEAALHKQGRAKDDDPIAYQEEVTRATVDVCMGIAASLGSQSEIVMTEVGPVKRAAADFYLTLAKKLQSEVSLVEDISFFNPEEYEFTYVEGVDDLPDEE